jgi:TolB protein
VRRAPYAGAAAVLLAWLPLAAAEAPPAVVLPRSSPEAQGIPSSALLDFVNAAEAKIDALHSFVVVRHGAVVAEGWWSPYQKADPHMLFSLSKSFTSTGIGLAVAEGRLTIDDPVLPYFPEDAPADPSANLKAMRVRDLLAMSTGHHAEDLQKFSFAGDERLTRAFLALPVAHKPGTHFLYNTPATYMLSAILQKATGTDLMEYLRPRLFEPLGIRNPSWEKSRDGITLGGYGLKVTTEDIARFGQLYLRKGQWGGRPLVRPEWIAAATARQVSNGSNPASDWDQGYGYQFWRCRHGVYRGDGAFGQFCVVMPEQDAVVAITSGTRDLQGVLNLVWEHILGPMKAAPLPADAAGRAALGRKLAGLTLAPQPGRPSSPRAASVTGRTYAFPANDDKIETARVDFDGDGATIVLRVAGREARVPCGAGAWRRGGTLPGPDGADQPVAASGAWTADDTYTARLYLNETPFRVTAAFGFADDRLTLDREYNVALGDAPTRRPVLVGQAEGARLGRFDTHGDVGAPKIAGSAAYNAVSQEYTLTAAGANMWAQRDEFHFAWRKMKGDFILQARVELVGKGVEPHRKAGWIVRTSLDPDSPYADALVHGDGLTSLQYRRTKGAITEQVESAVKGADVLQLERKGRTYIFSAARFGEPFTTSQVSDLDLGDDVHVGLFLCSHNPDVVEKAVFRDVRIIRPAREGFVPYRDYIGSLLEILDVETGHRRVVHASAQPFEAPNWTSDGGALIYNTSGRAEGRGRLYRFDLASRRPSLIDTGPNVRNNNDHVLSPDGTRLGISDQSVNEGRSTIFTLPVGGGRPKQITPLSPSYLHGWSPDGRFLVYTGGRNDEYDVYRIPADGSGPEVKLTDAKGLDDGPEYSPDGKYIYFNSARGGTMQIWRMKPDGADPEPVTSDEYNNWFPHFSPDGAWIAFLSYPREVGPTDHPYYKPVYLRLMPAAGGAPRVIAYVYGGQGTINVPSWSPDGKMLAFVSNSDEY